MLDFKINSSEIDKIGKFTKDEKDFRLKNLNYFNETGFPSKKNEDWKFSDFREIISKNFKRLNIELVKAQNKKINFIKEFEHNNIVLINGELVSSNFEFEEKKKIKIKNFPNNDFTNKKINNPLVHLNHALSDKGYLLEVNDNYKFRKILVIYNLYTDKLNENILNSKNMIIVGKNSELHTLELTVNESKNFFLNNVYENIILDDSAIFKNISIQNEKS